MCCSSDTIAQHTDISCQTWFSVGEFSLIDFTVRFIRAVRPGSQSATSPLVAHGPCGWNLPPSAFLACLTFSSSSSGSPSFAVVPLVLVRHLLPRCGGASVKRQRLRWRADLSINLLGWPQSSSGVPQRPPRIPVGNFLLGRSWSLRAEPATLGVFGLFDSILFLVWLSLHSKSCFSGGRIFRWMICLSGFILQLVFRNVHPESQSVTCPSGLSHIAKSSADSKKTSHPVGSTLSVQRWCIRMFLQTWSGYAWKGRRRRWRWPTLRMLR